MEKRMKIRGERWGRKDFLKWRRAYLVIVFHVAVVALAVGQVAAVGEADQVPVDPLEDLVYAVQVPPALRIALPVIRAVTEGAKQTNKNNYKKLKQ